MYKNKRALDHLLSIGRSSQEATWLRALWGYKWRRIVKAHCVHCVYGFTREDAQAASEVSGEDYTTEDLICWNLVVRMTGVGSPEVYCYLRTLDRHYEDWLLRREVEEIIEMHEEARHEDEEDQ